MPRLKRYLRFALPAVLAGGIAAAAFVAAAEKHVAALNEAIKDIPRDRVRLQVDEVGRVERVGLVVREGAVQLEVHRDDLQRQPGQPDGPDPPAQEEELMLRGKIHGYMLRHKVKPGITGWAQVNGWRGETPNVSWMERRVKYDLEYINRWTVLWDLKIVLLTIFGRKKNHNAY